MDKEAFERHKAFAGEKIASMKRRRVDHDYNGRQIYMVTLVVEGRRPLLGRLVGDVRAGRSGADRPRIEPSPLGEAVARVWRTIPDYHPGVELLGLQLMPDHLHGILFVTRHIEEGLGKVMLGFKQACNKEYRRLCGVNDAAVTQQQAAQQMLQPEVKDAARQAARQMPQQAARQAAQPQPPQRHTGHEAGLLFERGYNDSILLRDGQLEAMKRYLAENPYRLAMKRSRPEMLRVREAVEIGSWRCSAVGNMALLWAARRLQVRVSRSIDAGLLAQEKERLLAAARAGAVLVSPSISPGEKAIMRAAFDEGLPVIALAGNGLDLLQKPSGERFYACAEGRLLILSPFAHTNNRTVITREACNTLNALAWEICHAEAALR